MKWCLWHVNWPWLGCARRRPWRKPASPRSRPWEGAIQNSRRRTPEPRPRAPCCLPALEHRRVEPEEVLSRLARSTAASAARRLRFHRGTPDRIIVRALRGSSSSTRATTTLASGKTPEAVAADFQAFAARLLAALPKTRVSSSRSSPAQPLAPHRQDAQGERADPGVHQTDERLAFVDVAKPMIARTASRSPISMLRCSAHDPQGLQLWTSHLKPLLAEK